MANNLSNKSNNVENFKHKIELKEEEKLKYTRIKEKKIE